MHTVSRGGSSGEETIVVWTVSATRRRSYEVGVGVSEYEGSEIHFSFYLVKAGLWLGWCWFLCWLYCWLFLYIIYMVVYSFVCLFVSYHCKSMYYLFSHLTYSVNIVKQHVYICTFFYWIYNRGRSQKLQYITDMYL